MKSYYNTILIMNFKNIVQKLSPSMLNVIFEIRDIEEISYNFCNNELRSHWFLLLYRL